VTSRFSFPRVQVIPEVDRASFQVDGVERLAYHFGVGGSRPFLFPVKGPSGAHLTRMGHPVPRGNDHRKSVWLGHETIDGVNFREERPNSDTRIRHQAVKVYHDGVDFGGIVADLLWWSAGRALLRNELTVVLQPQDAGDAAIDVQCRFEAVDGPVEFGPTSFGFLAVQLATTLSEQFGGGSARNDRGARGTRGVHNCRSRWVDYSGPSRPGVVEGVCYMDHPDNPYHPTLWHVGGDGLLGAAFNMQSAFGVATDHPLMLRYRLLAHGGAPSVANLDSAWERYASTAPYVVQDTPNGGVPMITRGRSSGGRA
jgi:hypothetical protein